MAKKKAVEKEEVATKKAVEKEEVATKKGSDLLFTDSTKHKRALGIVDVLRGKPASAHLKSEYSADKDNSGVSPLDELVGKFEKMLAEADIDLKSDEAVMFVYKKLGGGVMTHQRAALIKEKAKKFKDSKKAKREAAKADDGLDDEGEEVEDDEDDEGVSSDDE